MRLHEPRPIDPVNTPLNIQRIDDEIVVLGPGPVAFSMTFDAARETCRRLSEVLGATPLAAAE